MEKDVGALLRQTARLIRDDDDYLSAQADAAFEACSNGDQSLQVERLVACALPIRRRVLLRWLNEQANQALNLISAAGIERILELLPEREGSVSVPLGNGVSVCRMYDRLVLELPSVKPALPHLLSTLDPNPTETLWGPFRIVAHRTTGFLAPTSKLGAWPCEAFLSQSKVGGRDLKVRGFEPGDRIRLNSGGTKKLQDIFTDAKIPRAMRSHWPVIELAGEIIWVPGYQVDCLVHVEGPEAESIHIRIEQISS